MTLHERIKTRLEETGLSLRAASLKAQLGADTLGKVLKQSEDAATLKTIRKLAAGLETTPEWLAYGLTRGAEGAILDQAKVVVDRAVLRDAVRFVLEMAGSSPTEAELIADIFPEALSGPPIDAVDRDPFQSFRVHLQLGSARSEPRPKR